MRSEHHGAVRNAKGRTLRNSLIFDEQPILPSKEPTISGTPPEAVAKETFQGLTASLKVFFIHGRPQWSGTAMPARYHGTGWIVLSELCGIYLITLFLTQTSQTKSESY